jgi:hypothetical protein
LLILPRHSDAEATAKKLGAAILARQPHHEGMAIRPVRQLIRRK